MASTAKNLCTLKKLAGLISDENFNLKFQKLTTVEANLNLSKEEFKGWLSECIETQVPALWLSEIFRNLCLFSPVRSDLVYKDNFTSEVQLVDELIIRGMGSCHSLLKLRLSNLFDETQLLKDFYRLCSWGVIWFNEGAKEENPEVVKEFLQRKLRHQDSDPFLLLDIYKNVTREECINFVKKDLYWLESYRELSLDKLINSYHQAVEKYIKRTNSEFLLPELNKAISDSSSHKNFQKQRVEQRVEDLLKLGNYKVAKALMYDRLMNGEVTPRTRLLMLWLEMAQKSRAHQQQSFRFRLSSELEELKKFEGYKPIFHYVSYLYHKKLKNDRLARMSMLTLKALDENYLPTQSSRWLHHVHGKLRQGLFNLGRTVKSRYSEAL